MSRFNIVVPKAPELHSPVCEFLRPMLVHRLVNAGSYSPEPDPRSMPLYETPFDPAFITTEGMASCLWRGYHPSGLRYLRAQAEQVTAWVIPTMSALPSLMFFLGGEVTTAASRMAVLAPNKIDLMMAYQSVYNKGGLRDYEIAEREEGRAPKVGLWLDYEAPRNEQNVINFLRLVNALREEHLKQDSYMFPIDFVIATQGADHMPEAMKTFELNLNIHFTKDIAAMIAEVDVYINLDNCPTAYDPIIAVLGAKPNGPQVLAPSSRLELVGHVRSLDLPPAVNNVLEALLHPGSPGIGGLVQSFYPCYNEIATLVSHSISERDI